MTQLPGDDPGFDPKRDPNRNQDHDWPLHPQQRPIHHSRHDLLSTRLIVGLLIILLGGTLLADNLGWFEARHVLRSLWPLVLVAVGVAMIRHPQHRRSRAWGWVLVTIGIWIFADKIGWIHVSLGQLILPGILLFVGGVLVFRSLSGPPSGPSITPTSAPDTNGTINTGSSNGTSQGFTSTSFGGAQQSADQAEFVRSFAMLSGHELRPVSRPFRGADLNAIMGGIKLDLTSARMEGDSAVIEVFAFWGGVEIYVPPDWTVTSEVTTLLAGFIDKRRPTTVVPTKHLVIKGMVVMAGVEIKN
jgi:predicted membrane protein